VHGCNPVGFLPLRDRMIRWFVCSGLLLPAILTCCHPLPRACSRRFPVSERRSWLSGTAVSVLVGIAILAVVTAALFAGKREIETPERVTSVDSVNLVDGEEAAPSVAATAADNGHGRAIYNKSCAACHVTGAANAPKLGDKAAWEQRIARGLDQLLQTVMAGQGAMPPRGTCIDCSDEDLTIAIEYMLGRVGFEPTESTDAVSVLEGTTGEQGAAAAAQGPANQRPDVAKGG